MENEITERIIGAAIEVHKHLGPGLLEAVYEECLCYEFSQRRLQFQRQLAAPVLYKGIKLDCDPTTVYAALLEGRYRGLGRRMRQRLRRLPAACAQDKQRNQCEASQMLVSHGPEFGSYHSSRNEN